MNELATIKKIIEHSFSGDLDALSRLIRIVQLEGAKNSDYQKLIINALADIFFIENATKNQKQMIWALRDTHVFTYYEERRRIDDEGDLVPEFISYEFTFLQYLIEFYRNELEIITGGNFEVHSRGFRGSGLGNILFIKK